MTPTLLLAAVLIGAVAQDHGRHKQAMDHRGHQAMGFDQSKATHTFTSTDTGGTIAIAANSASDSATIDQIRAHLKEIAKLFKDGDFSKPRFIHGGMPPGADVMKASRAAIDYRYEETAAGGKVVIASADRDAVAAIHRYLEYQKNEHR